MKLLAQLCCSCSTAKTEAMRLFCQIKLSEEKHRILTRIQTDFRMDIEDGPWEKEYIELRYYFEQMDICCYECIGETNAIAMMVDELMQEKLIEISNDEAEMLAIEKRRPFVAEIVAISRLRRERDRIISEKKKQSKE